MFIFLLCIVTCCGAILWWQNLKDDPTAPPVYPGGMPLFGNAHQFLGNSIELWRFVKEMSYFSLQNGGVSTVYLGMACRIYFVTDPDDCLTLANNCLDKPFVYDIVKEWCSNSLITADVSIWKPHRKLLNPMFSQQMLNENLEIFNRQARRLVNKMSVELGNEKFDSHKYVAANTIETIAEIIMGLKGEKYEEIIKEYTEAVLAMLNAIKNRKDELKKYKLECGTKTKESEPDSFLDIMLKLQDSQNAFTDVDIREHLDMLTFAGYDTTTETLTFCMKLIGLNTQVQEKIYEELQEIFGDKNVDVTRYDLPRLVYLDAVVKETLRIYSTVPLAARSIRKDVKLKKYTLRAGSIGVISGIGLHRNPMWGPDAEEFKPERWLDPALPVNENPNLFGAFSLGKRNCIGKWYALISIKTTLAHIMRQYRIKTDDSKMKIKFDIVIRSISGHEIILERR